MNPDKDLLKSIQELSKCPSCVLPYETDDINMLGQLENYLLVHFTCNRCFMSLLTVFPAKQFKINKKLELSPVEVKKFQGLDAITTDEIIDMYQYLKKF